MSKITSKLQVTLPKAIAQQYGLRPGDEIEFLPAGDAIRIVPKKPQAASDASRPLKSFDMATSRQRHRNVRQGTAKRPKARGWRREELYVRGKPR